MYKKIYSEPGFRALFQQESLTGRSDSLQAIASLVNPAPTSRSRGILHLEQVKKT